MTASQIKGPNGSSSSAVVIPATVYSPIDQVSYQIPNDAGFVGFPAANFATPTITLPQLPTPGQKLTLALTGAQTFNPNLVLPSGYTVSGGLPASSWAGGQGSQLILQFTDNTQKIWHRLLHIE